VASIIQFNDRDDTQVRATQNKIRDQLREPIPNCLPIGMIFWNVDQLRQSDLDEKPMTGIQAQQALIKRLLSLRKQPLWLDRP
jgi:hypothetical protein